MVLNVEAVKILILRSENRRVRDPQRFMGIKKSTLHVDEKGLDDISHMASLSIILRTELN